MSSTTRCWQEEEVVDYVIMYLKSLLPHISFLKYAKTIYSTHAHGHSLPTHSHLAPDGDWVCHGESKGLRVGHARVVLAQPHRGAYERVRPDLLDVVRDLHAVVGPGRQGQGRRAAGVHEDDRATLCVQFDLGGFGGKE